MTLIVKELKIEKSLILELNQLIESYKVYYTHESILKNLFETDLEHLIKQFLNEKKTKYGYIEYKRLNSDIKFSILTQKSQDKKKIFKELAMVSDKYNISDYLLVKQLFLLLLDIKDYLTGKMVCTLSQKRGIDIDHIKSLLSTVFSDKNQFNSRFLKLTTKR